MQPNNKMDKREISRIEKIINESISVMQMDLKGKTILTEVGSEYFAFTPVIALKAGADKVFAWVRDSRFGTAKDIVEKCLEIMKYLNVEGNLEFGINERPRRHVAEADIITNLGFVRPLNKELLSLVKPDVAISGMCEAWELRPSDIDITYCKEHKLKLAGTWENHPDLKIFDGCGHLAVKMALEAGFEVYQNNIIVWSNDHFGEVVVREFKNFGARSVIQTVKPEELYDNLADSDFIFFCDYNEKRKLIGKEGIIDISKMQGINGGVGLVHLYGHFDRDELVNENISLYPDKNGQASCMTYTLAHLGPLLMIKLHAAGLKVGQCLSDHLSHPFVQTVVS